jgi:hypothetical protein
MGGMFWVALDRWPWPLTDQRGAELFAWFAAGVPVSLVHVLPRPVYDELCRLAGVRSGATWVAFGTRADAIASVAAVCRAIRKWPAAVRS